MKRIWIILLTASLLVLAGCGGKEPVAFSGSTESQPPGMETSADSASPVENTALQQESTENIANVKEPSEARTTEYVPAASVTTADENEAPSPEQPSSQLVNEEQESRPSEAEPEPTTPEPQEPPAPSETPPDPVGEPQRKSLPKSLNRNPISTSVTGSATQKELQPKKGWPLILQLWTAGTTRSRQTRTAFTWNGTSTPD